MAENMPHYALHYLKGDPRRLRIGMFNDHHQSESIKLVEAVAMAATPQQRLELETLICSTSMYRSGLVLEPDQVDWDRKARVRLLNAIPNELLSPVVRQFLESEKLAVPDWDEERHSSRAGFVREVPPISKEDILKSSDDEIFSAIDASREPDRHSHFDKVEVEGGWEMPGGPIAAGREIAEVAKLDPTRAMGLSIGLMERGHEDAVSAAIQSLSEATIDDLDVIEFVRALISHDVQSEELKSRIGYLLYRRCPASVGLDEDLCRVLKTWLSESWSSTHSTRDSEQESEDAIAPESISSFLWSPQHALVDTDRSFWPLLALTRAYLLRTPAAVSAWLDVLDAKLASISESTLKAFLSELRWFRLDPASHAQGERIVEKVFRQFPNLRFEREGVSLVAHVTDLLSISCLEEFLSELRKSLTYKVRQAFGELLTLVALRGAPHDWAMPQLQKILEVPAQLADDAALVGVAFTAAQFWDDPEIRPAASRLLSSLAKNTSPNISRAMGTVCFAKESFANDSDTEQLLVSLADNPVSLTHFPVLDLCEHLEKLLPHNRTLVLRMCQALLKAKSDESQLFEAGPQMVNMAMTFQRFADTRSEGLELFERFLKLGLDDAFNALHEIDIRPAPGPQRQGFTRRRRKRR